MAKKRRIHSNILNHTSQVKCGLCFMFCISAIIFFNSLVFAADPEAVITINEPDWYTDTSYFPDLDMSITRGYAAFPVFFQGWQSTPREEIVSYSWDFGEGTETDEGGRYFHGLNACHVYEIPGTYIATLKVKDINGSWSTAATVTIEVLSRDAGRSFYVDSETGSDDYDGTSMSVDGNSGPWRTATKAFQQMARPSQWADFDLWHYKPGDRILFKRGQTFTMDENLIIGHGFGTQGYSFETYGNPSDPKPVIQYNGTSEEHMLYFGYGTGYITFKDLEFNFLGSEQQSNGLIFATGALKNLLFLRCDFHEPNNGIYSLNGRKDADTKITNVFTVNCTIQNIETCPTSITQMYASAVHGFVLANNKFDKSGNHIGYFGSLDKGLITRNIFSRPAWGRTCLRITGGDPQNPANNIHIMDNRFLGWVDPFIGGSGRVGGAHGTETDLYNYLLVNLGPNTTNDNAYLMLRDIIFERNIITNARGLMNICNADNIIVRNNMFITPDDSPVSIYISHPLADWISRPNRNIHILNNNFINIINQNMSYSPDTRISRAFIQVYNYEGLDTGFGDRHENINIKNNIFYTSNGRSGQLINISDSNRGILNEIHSDYNLFHLPDTPTSSWFQVGETYYSLDAWRQIREGLDCHSIVADPNFSAALPFRNHNSGDPDSLTSNNAEADEYISILQLNGTSQAINKGIEVQVYDDFHGTARPQNSVFDIGAFEYNGFSVHMPSMLRIKLF